jgi:hydrogenase nickel incorporation protein HypB
LIFVDADAVIINKMDLLPHVDFDIAAFRGSVSGLNPDADVFQISCKTGQGIEQWCSWILQQVESHAMKR